MSGVFDKIVEVLPSLPNELPRIIKTERSRDESEADKLVDDCDQIDLETSFDEDQVSFTPGMSRCLLDYRPGPTQTGLYSHRRWLEA